MFVQTRDRVNWQTRYVVQHPFEGTLQECRGKTRACEATCTTAWGQGPPDSTSQQANLAQCLQSCEASQQGALEQARRCYEVNLPQRRRTELQTLRRYTGWSAEEAQRFSRTAPELDVTSLPGLKATWRQKMFGTQAAGKTEPR